VVPLALSDRVLLVVPEVPLALSDRVLLVVPEVLVVLSDRVLPVVPGDFEETVIFQVLVGYFQLFLLVTFADAVLVNF
jgi:hypothetical protein